MTPEMHVRTDFPLSLSERVRARRHELNIRQQDLADLAGVSVRFVHMVEARKPTVQLDKVLAVLEVLGLELDVVARSAGRRASIRSGT